jgi:hypothetical protein
MALFELTELASYLQQDLDTATATLARELATGIVEEVTGPLESRTSTANLPILVNGDIELPTPVVTAITSVGIDEAAQTFTWYRPFPVLHLDDYTAPSDPDDWTYAEVTWTHGFPVVPAVVKAVALSVAARAYVVTPPPGVTLQIDDYRESTSAASAGSESSGLMLTDLERRALASVGGVGAYVTGA